MFYIEKLNHYKHDIVGMSEELQQHRNKGNDRSAERVEKWLLEKLNDWKKLIETFNTFGLLGGKFKYLDYHENVDTAIKFIKEDNLLVSNAIRVASDINLFVELL